jgi:2'-5' RNA ligase
VLARAAVFGLAIHLASCAGAPVAPAPSPAPVAAPAHPGGNLFSTIPCAGTPLGRAWARLLPEAAARFPDLKLTRVEDLHVTVVYVGPGWRTEDLGRIRELALVAPGETATIRPEIVRFGANGHVVAAELRGAPTSWLSAVAGAKAEMNRLDLKKPDRYDTQFRPHVTLASARNRPPAASESAALDALRAWVAEQAAAEPGAWVVPLGPDSPVRLWLAGLERPAGAPEYVDLESLGRSR